MTCSPEKVRIADHVVVRGQDEESTPHDCEARKIIDVIPASVYPTALRNRLRYWKVAIIVG